MLENTNVAGIQKGIQAVYKMSADERTRELIRMREKALHDEASLIEEAMEKGEAKGMEKGIAKGRDEGRAEGRAEERASIAEKMRADGVPEDIIKKYLS